MIWDYGFETDNEEWVSLLDSDSCECDNNCNDYVISETIPRKILCFDDDAFEINRGKWQPLFSVDHVHQRIAYVFNNLTEMNIEDVTIDTQFDNYFHRELWIIWKTMYNSGIYQ